MGLLRLARNDGHIELTVYLLNMLLFKNIFMNKFVKAAVSFLLHIGAAVSIIWAFWPMAKWYFDAKPLWGVDFYYTATLTNLLKSNLTLPPLSWNYAWFAGWPNFSSQPMLHYYLILPLTFYFDLLISVKIWMLASLGIFTLGIYAASFALSRNRGLAIVVSIAGIYSVGVYGALMWGGSLPNFATQSFFPWVLFFLIQFLKSHNFRWLFGAAGATGISILGHPQIAIAYIFPSSAIVLLFSFGQLKFFNRVKALIMYVTVALIIGLPLIYSSTGSLKSLIATDALTTASSTARVETGVAQEILEFHRAQPKRIFTDTNRTFFILLIAALAFYIVSLLLRHRRKELFAGIPFMLLALYYVAYINVFAYGISIYHGGWYRLFWSVPVWIALLTSVWWGVAEASVKEVFGRYKLIVSPILTVGILITGIYLISQYSQDTKEKIVPRSNPSSAFPDVLNLRTDKIGLEKLKSEMTPDWLDGNRVDYRLYDGDQTVNIWWNTIYNMPLARGYLDPPNKPALGYRFWVDAALSIDNATGEDQLVGSFNYPPEIAFNNTLFLVDWYAIKHFEANREGPTTIAILPPKLTSEEKITHIEELDFNKEKYNTGNQTLRYYELKDEYVSPILMPTSAPILGIFASDEGYEVVIRALADANLGLHAVIPVKLGRSLDARSLSDLSDFNALFLYDYKYQNKNRAYRQLNEYVNSGGRLYVDTGVEVAESDAQKLPEIFPVAATYRKPLGREWQLSNTNAQLGEGVDFSAFDPPLFDDAEWKLSYPRSSSDIRPKSEVILTHGDYALMVIGSSGKGEVIWSGLNLPYHVIRFHNGNEVTFFTNIINRLLPVNSTETSTTSAQTHFISAQKRTITSPGGTKGVLFKEQNYPGWQAKINSNSRNQKVKIWSSGPAYPGFMYVHIPKNLSGKETTVTFSYHGSSLTWFFSLLSFITILYIADYSILGGKILTKGTRRLLQIPRRHLKRWWVKEDEE